MTDHKQMIKDCQDRESRLNEWEAGFISSCEDRLDGGCGLTPKQTETLDRIWEKVTREG